MTDGERTRIVEELVEQHSLSLYRFAYRLSGTAADAEDLVQQAFLAAQRKLDQVRDPEKTRSWLFTIVRNTYLKSRRSLEFKQFDAFDGMADPAIEDEGPIDQEELQAALDEMPEDFRIPLILFYLQQMSYREIATQLSVPEGTVMSRLSRAKAYLRRRLISRLGDAAPAGLAADASS
ncbi:MAG: RNA polymerase sigma factor [Planctomycetaceae bacterium]|nr:RNA polymerase sigma factor [Planctomycetaceae bacterium]